jgi:hypothetical protein
MIDKQGETKKERAWEFMSAQGSKGILASLEFKGYYFSRV